MSHNLTPGEPGRFLYSVFHAHSREKLLFAYRGAMDEAIMEAILGISEHTLEEHTALASANRKVSFLLVECFQNILRHGAMTPQPRPQSDQAMFSFRSFDDVFYINSSNTIHEVDRGRLIEIVDLVNGLDKEGLTALYRSRLSNNAIGERGGAGLGLIELSRKSGRPIRYRFDSNSDGQTLFHNQVTFGKGDAPELDIDTDASDVFAQMAQANLLLVYKGDMSQRSILPLLSMTEVNTGLLDQTRTMRKVGHVLIEMLQNIARHSDATNGQREGVMAVGVRDGAYTLCVGNFVSAQQMEYLQQQINELNTAGEVELKAMYRAKFQASLNRDDRYSSGLGLVQIARDAGGRLQATFTPEPDGRIFFTLCVVV